MPVSVNPVRAKDEGFGDVFNAVRLATDLYKVNLTNEQNELLRQQQAKEKADALEREQRTGARDFKSKYVPVDEPTFGELKKQNVPILGAEDLPPMVTLGEGQRGFVAASDLRDIENRRIQAQAKRDAKQREEIEALSEADEEVRKDKKIVEAADNISDAALIEELINKEKPIADQFLMRKLFRISGDVGAIRAEDLRQLGSSPEAKEQFLQWVNSATVGETIRPEARESIREIVGVIGRQNREKIRSRLGGISTTLARRTSLTGDEAYAQLEKQIDENIRNRMVQDIKQRQLMSGGLETSEGMPIAGNEQLKTSTGEIADRQAIMEELKRRGLNVNQGITAGQ